MIAWEWGEGAGVYNTHAHDFIVITHAFPTQISNSSIFCILVQQFWPILKYALLDISNLSFHPNKSFI